MPVYQIENEMPHHELLMWAQYLQARPIGWREDNRTAMMLQSQGVKEEARNIFPTLNQMKRWEEDAETEEAMKKSLRRSVFGVMLEGANKGK